MIAKLREAITFCVETVQDPCLKVHISRDQWLTSFRILKEEEEQEEEEEEEEKKDPRHGPFNFFFLSIHVGY